MLLGYGKLYGQLENGKVNIIMYTWYGHKHFHQLK